MKITELDLTKKIRRENWLEDFYLFNEKGHLKYNLIIQDLAKGESRLQSSVYMFSVEDLSSEDWLYYNSPNNE